MNQKTSKVEKEFYLRCSYLTLSVLFDKEPNFVAAPFKFILSFGRTCGRSVKFLVRLRFIKINS